MTPICTVPLTPQADRLAVTSPDWRDFCEDEVAFSPNILGASKAQSQAAGIRGPAPQAGRRAVSFQPLGVAAGAEGRGFPVDGSGCVDAFRTRSFTFSYSPEPSVHQGQRSRGSECENRPATFTL